MTAPETNPRIGIFSDISNADYHRFDPDQPSYSSTIIKMMDVPVKARYALDNPGKYKECYRIGEAIHMYQLEPIKFVGRFLLGIDCARRSKADKSEWSQWFYEHGGDGDHITSHKAAEWNQLFEEQSGKHMVTPDEIQHIKLMSESIMSNPDAAALLEQGAAEQSAFWEDSETGLILRCRPDYLRPGGFISDLKSCQSADPGAFARTCHNLRYHIQAAMYQDGIQQLTGEFTRFFFIAIEKSPPYCCAVYQLNDESAELGYRIYRNHMRRLVDCLDSGKWPGIPSDLELHLPAYAFKDYNYD